LISAKRGQPPEYDPPRVTEIRDAIREDAPAACEVIRRSISELCGADHRNDPEILGRWLANKTQEIVGSWIIKPGNSVLVAVDDNSILAVGAVTDAGEITLNYVSPDVRFRGVSRAMLTTLEARTLERGTDRSTLLSTETAHRFRPPLAVRMADVQPEPVEWLWEPYIPKKLTSIEGDPGIGKSWLTMARDAWMKTPFSVPSRRAPH
jgi:hypothetical protein